MDEEAKQLLREIRDLMAGSQARYDQAIAENKRLSQEHLAKTQRLALIMAALVGTGVAALLYFAN
jgi:hypothetical protein